MLKVEIKTSYSEETFVIPDWDPERATDFYGHKFFSVEQYVEFYLYGMRAFCDEFEIVSITTATEPEIEKARHIAEDNWEEEFDYELLEACVSARQRNMER